MISLRKAVKEGKLRRFIKERTKDDPGDLEKLNEALRRPASEKSKEAPKSLSRDNRDD